MYRAVGVQGCPIVLTRREGGGDLVLAGWGRGAGLLLEASCRVEGRGVPGETAHLGLDHGHGRAATPRERPRQGQGGVLDGDDLTAAR